MNQIAVETASSQGTLIGRALELLGSGVPQEAVASALGVTASYVSQLLSDTDFAQKVTQLKYEALSKHTARDESYDTLEDSLLVKLEKALPLLLRPSDILGAIKVVNGAKRRGTDSKESIIAQQNIVEITIPTQIIQQFTTNINNQVVKAGDQDLITIQSNDLLKSVEDKLPELENLTKTKESQAPTPNVITNTIESNTILDSL